MSLVEQARERVEGARTRITARIEAIRGGGGGGGSPELPTLKEIREKGVLAVLGEKFPRVKEIRERGILATKKGEEVPTTTEEVKGEVRRRKILA